MISQAMDRFLRLGYFDRTIFSISLTATEILYFTSFSGCAQLVEGELITLLYARYDEI